MSVVSLTDLSVEPERRLGRWAAAAAFAGVAASIGALFAANSTGGARTSIAATGARDSKQAQLDQIQSFHAGPDAQALAVTLRCIGILVAVGVAVYLVWLIRRRGTDAGRWIVWSAAAGAVLISASTIWGYFALQDVVDTFYASGPRTAERASQLIGDSTAMRVATIGDFTSRIVFAPWVIACSLYLLRLGLLDTFLGYFGIAGGAALVLLPIGDAMYIGWLVSLGVIFLGYWPSGRPPAWDDPRLTGTPAAAAV